MMSDKIVNSFAFAFILMILTCGTASAFSDSGGGTWKYQREIVIHENSGETLTDYQVLIELKGDDFPGEAQSDGADIRFTDENVGELNYWIEEFNKGSRNIKVWVKVPEIQARGETKIILWYGNPDAGRASDGEAVFEFFDDFDDGLLDNTKWRPAKGGFGKTDESGGTLNLEAPDTLDRSYGVHSINYFNPSNIAIKFKSNVKYMVWTQVGLENTDGDLQGGDDYIIFYFQHPQKEGDLIARFIDNKVTQDYAISFIHDIYATREMQFTDFNTANFLENGDILKSGWSSPEDSMRLHLAASGNFGWKEGVDNANIDWIFVRRFTNLDTTITLKEPISSRLSITKSASLVSIRQHQETTITISLENSDNSDITDVKVTDSIHSSFERVAGDFPNPKRFDLMRPGETREIKYTLRAKESGTFNLDPAGVTYADGDRNIQEGESDATSIKVIQDEEDGTLSSSSSASVNLHGEKSNVVLGEDILLKLSAVNLITKPTMHVQVIIIPPTGMSVTSSEFVQSGAGQFTTTYELEPGNGRDIEVKIKSNQVGDFNVEGRVVYYFGNDKEKSEDHTLTLPIEVRAEADGPTPPPQPTEPSQGFGLIAAFCSILVVLYLRIRR